LKQGMEGDGAPLAFANHPGPPLALASAGVISLS